MKRIIKIIFVIGLLIVLFNLDYIEYKYENDVLDSYIVNNEDNVVGILDIDDKSTYVLQGTDNEYYLSHLKDGSYNILGSQFMDYRNKINDKIIIIYGHNSKIYDTFFKRLMSYLDINYYKEHRYFKFNGNKYEIFSVSIYDKNYDYYNLDIIDYDKHFNDLKEKSIYDTEVNVNDNDDILILQTCTTRKEYEYLVIVGKRIGE